MPRGIWFDRTALASLKQLQQLSLWNWPYLYLGGNMGDMTCRKSLTNWLYPCPALTNMQSRASGTCWHGAYACSRVPGQNLHGRSMWLSCKSHNAIASAWPPCAGTIQRLRLNGVGESEEHLLPTLTNLISLHVEGSLSSSAALQALPPPGVLKEVMLARCGSTRKLMPSHAPAPQGRFNVAVLVQCCCAGRGGKHEAPWDPIRIVLILELELQSLDYCYTARKGSLSVEEHAVRAAAGNSRTALWSPSAHRPAWRSCTWATRPS